MSRVRPAPHLGDLVRFAPHNEGHWVALRMGLAVGVPLVLLIATGHERWMLYATFGAFAAVYGRSEGYRRRLHMQAASGVVQVLAVVLAVALCVAVAASGAGRWAVVLAAAVTAFGSSLVGDTVRWRPSGPLFAVFGGRVMGGSASRAR